LYLGGLILRKAGGRNHGMNIARNHGILKRPVGIFMGNHKTGRKKVGRGGAVVMVAHSK